MEIDRSATNFVEDRSRKNVPITEADHPIRLNELQFTGPKAAINVRDVPIRKTTGKQTRFPP